MHAWPCRLRASGRECEGLTRRAAAACRALQVVVVHPLPAGGAMPSALGAGTPMVFEEAAYTLSGGAPHSTYLPCMRACMHACSLSLHACMHPCASSAALPRLGLPLRCITLLTASTRPSGTRALLPRQA